ncbi:Hemocyanin, all-alpha domain [Popillia japonica]|uniref:Hemocyanin, all-alpha domain n=1 Tax=Popillia japonica TaxID=7064 RepID=A0AAW1ITF9_POPJA
MKAILLLAGLCALAVAVPTPTKWIPKKYKIDDKALLEKQLNTLRLYKYINQPLFDKDFVDIAHSYDPEAHLDLYTHSEYVSKFMFYYRHSILPKGQLFTIFDPHHLKQAVALFKTFYYAKDYDTFFKTAVWAREYVNEYMWVYAYTVALVHRPDTYGIVLPPMYEIYPYYFFDSEVIHKAQYYKQIYHSEYPTTDDYTGYTIVANYTGTNINNGTSVIHSGWIAKNFI